MITKCPVCSCEELHKDDKIHSESVIVICKKCGFACHDYDEAKEAELLSFYKSEHRKTVVGKQKPDYQNILTTNFKKASISKFLADYLKDKKNLIIGDVGAATGYLVHWFRSLGHRATGSEYALEYRRMSEHYYGIPLTEELSDKRKYDLITIYHVLEHMMRPDLKLKKYRDMLTDTGHMLVSVPEYFNRLDEGVGTNVITPGATAQSMFDTYFNTSHINIVSRTAIKNLIQMAGFSIVKEDYEGCGMTFLCAKNPTDNIYSPVLEDWQAVYAKMKAVKTAFEHVRADDFKKALEAYPEFPEAHIAMIMRVYQKDTAHQQDYMAEIEKTCPETTKGTRYLSTKGMWLYQNQKYQAALETFERCVDLRPNPDIFMFMSWCLLELGRNKDAIKILNYCMMVSPAKWQEAVNFQIHAACNMPTWDEVALAEMTQTVEDKNRAIISATEPKDPVMNGG